MHRIPVNMKLVMVIVLLLGLLLPFAGKAFHIDDPISIYTGRHILKSPFRPFDFNFNWYGKEQSMWLEDNPPLIYYYVAAIILMFGESEVSLHLSFLIFPVIAAIGMYFLGKRFTRQAILCVILMIATPAFLVMSTNIMLDVPLLAFYIASIATFVYGVDRNDNRLKILSGILIGLAALTKYTGLTLIPLLAAYIIMKRKDIWKSLWIFLIPIFIFTLWCIHNLITNGSIHFIEAAGILNFKPDALHQKLVGTLSFMGGATIFPLLVPILLFAKKRDVFTYAISSFLAILLCHNLLRRLNYHPIQETFVIFFVWIAIILFIKISNIIIQYFRLKIKEQREILDIGIIDNIFLFLWFSGIFCFNVIAEYAAVRYVLILIPPLILLGVRMVGNTAIQKLKFVMGSLTIILSLALSISVTYADYEYAGVYRTCAKKLKKEFRDLGRQLFFQSHWGFQYQYQYYMKREGFVPAVSKDTKIVQGDILIGSPQNSPSPLPDSVRELTHIYTLSHPLSFPLLVMHVEGKAGFYNHEIGFLPYTIVRGHEEEFNVWRYDNWDMGNKVKYDFIDSLSKGKIETPDKNYIFVKYTVIDEKLKRVLLEHPPSKITYKVRIPAMSNLCFSIATEPASWEKDSDGITFGITVKNKDDEKKVFGKMLNPCYNKVEREWHDYSINLSQFSNEEVEIIFETGPGPNNDLKYDWAIWANPIIMQESANTNGSE